MEILGDFGEIYPSLGLERQTRDALKRYVDLRWHSSRRKAVEQEWGLTPDEARSVCEASASAATIDKVWKRGGWAVIFPVLGAVVGIEADAFIRNERKRHVAIAARHRALGRDLRAGLDLFTVGRGQQAPDLDRVGRARSGGMVVGPDQGAVSRPVGPQSEIRPRRRGPP